MEQYKTENAKLEKDLPTLREVVGGTWMEECTFRNGGIRKRGIEGFVVIGWDLMGRFFG